jgi:hypothetical protein
MSMMVSNYNFNKNYSLNILDYSNEKVMYSIFFIGHQVTEWYIMIKYSNYDD